MVMCSAKVSVPVVPSATWPLNASSIRPDTAPVGLWLPVSVHVVDPVHVPVQSLVPVQTKSPVLGSKLMMCATHAPTGSLQVPFTLSECSGCEGPAEAGGAPLRVTRATTARARITARETSVAGAA